MKRAELSAPALIRFECLAGESRLAHWFTTRLLPGNVTVPGVRQEIASTLLEGSPGMVVPSQVHGDRVACISGFEPNQPVADALATDQPGVCIGILVADCFPLLFFDPDRPAVAVVHAGWRGVAADIQGKTVEVLQERFLTVPRHLSAVIGPGIGSCCFEVGDEVVSVFQAHPGFDERWIVHRRGKTFADLRAVIRSDLVRSGIPDQSVETVPLCTACRDDLFYSYRRDGPSTGRMLLAAALVKP